MEFTEQRAAVLLELHTMIRAYRIMQDLVDAGGATRHFSERCEEAGFAVVDYRRIHQITSEEEKQFSKSIRRGAHAAS